MINSNPVFRFEWNKSLYKNQAHEAIGFMGERHRPGFPLPQKEGDIRFSRAPLTARAVAEKKAAEIKV
jgi:hypothetical protein